MPTLPDNPTIAVVEGVNGHEPKMCDRRMQEPVNCLRQIEPLEERLHFCLDALGRWGLIIVSSPSS